MAHTRRDFIKRGVTFVGAGLVAPRVLLGPAEAFARTASDGRILVIVELNGGNDGLNTVVPFTQSAYYTARPRIAYREDQVLQFAEDLGFHPALGGFKSLYDAGKLAVVQGVGYPNSDRSHFRSTEIWQTSRPETVAPTGWIGRYLDSQATAADSTLEAVNIGFQVPATLVGQTPLTASVASVDAYEFQANPRYPQDEQNARAVFSGIYDDARGTGTTVDFLAQTGLTAYESAQVLAGSAAGYRPDAVYPGDPFSQSLLLIAQIVNAGLGTNVFYTSLGSFDTHANQANQHATLLRWLGDGLAAFHQDLSAKGLGDDLLVMTFSEFGRRVAENGSLGTDHGAAAPLFVIGDTVRGGVYGDHPSLSELEQGDLAHGIDFRAVYGTVLRHWLDVSDHSPILGGTFEDIGFLAPASAKRTSARKAPRRTQDALAPSSLAELEVAMRAANPFRGL